MKRAYLVVAFLVWRWYLRVPSFAWLRSPERSFRSRRRCRPTPIQRTGSTSAEWTQRNLRFCIVVVGHTPPSGGAAGGADTDFLSRATTYLDPSAARGLLSFKPMC